MLKCWNKPKKQSEVVAWNEAVDELFGLCYDNPYLFHLAVLGGPPLFDYQMDILQCVLDNDVAVIASGNSMGKSYVSRLITLWYGCTRRNSLVITTSSSQTQLNNVLWKNIRAGIANAKIPLGGKLNAPGAIPQRYSFGDEWFLIGQSSTACEKMAGQHPSTGKSLVLVDEASGLSQAVFDGIKSLNPEKTVYVGNPLHASGPFYEVYRTAERGERGFGYRKISCFQSPDIDKWKSERGLACQKFLHEIRASDGEGSAYWLSHILAEFPTETSESLIPRDWLDLAEQAEHVPGGQRRLTVDLALGVGRDQTVICVRDDNGIFYLEGSNKWKYEETASRVDRLMRQYKVEPRNVVYDANGPGHDFGNRLLQYGISGVREFVGSRSEGGPKNRYFNNRTAGAYGLKQRLDPGRLLGPPVDGVTPMPQQFAISKEHMKLLRPQLQALSVKNAEDNKVRLLNKEEIAAKLGCSPDYADCVCMGFFYKR